MELRRAGQEAPLLRGGDCGEEVGNIQRRLRETKDLADRELDRVQCEEPQALSSTVEDTTAPGQDLGSGGSSGNVSSDPVTAVVAPASP
ncbi:hypothetical protein NKR19_g9191 [Coniochaeta hoffmannii]|uniref:Uncharacterized protein n=1 Tax=Coniochaeta hoffmannii TaxID=91930 RepID=A0AA38R8P7_9PEZI|nr:hypothetical protein NKR19_g9191 [Coniochaeta hoffmannii]